MGTGKACNFVVPFIGKYWWRRRDATPVSLHLISKVEREKREIERERERKGDRRNPATTTRWKTKRASNVPANCA